MGTCAICGLSGRGSEDEGVFGGAGGGLDGLGAFEVDRDAVNGVAEVEEVVEGAAIVAGRRWMTVFTVTLLVVPGEKGREASGSFGRTRKVFPSGIGGIIREWYMVFWSLEASERVFWKRDLGWGVVEGPM